MSAPNIHIVFPGIGLKFADAQIDKLQGLGDYFDGVILEVVAIGRFFPLLALELELLLQ